MVVLSTLIVLTIVTIGTMQTLPTYTASVKLRVSAGGSGSSSLITDFDRVINTYADLAASRPVLSELTQRLGLGDPTGLEKRVKVELILNTELMKLSVTDADPDSAKDKANTLADILTERSLEYFVGSAKATQQILNQQLAEIGQELDEARARYSKENIPPSIELKQNTYASLLQQYEEGRISEASRANILTVVEPAVTPDAPSSPRTARNLAMGAAVGLLAGVALALIFENLDTRLYSVEQIEKTLEQAPLGAIPTARRLRHCDRSGGNSREDVAFRRLLVSIYAQSSGKPLRTLLVTSAAADEGKSIVVGNLARAMAQAGQRVIVVDCHFRAPALHGIFGLPNKVGLSNVLSGEVDAADAIQVTKGDARVAVLTSGPPIAPAVAWQHLGNVAALLENLSNQFDVVLADGPDLLSEADAAMLASRVNAVLLVVGLARSKAESLRAARKQLNEVRARQIGVVVNRVGMLAQ